MGRGKRRQGLQAQAQPPVAAVTPTPALDPPPPPASAATPSAPKSPPKRAAAGKATREGFSLFPSDMTWLYNDCPCCFYLKVKQGVRRPGGPMPKIFGVIDGAIRRYCEGKRTQDVCPDMPPGVFLRGEEWVQSRPISILGHREKIILKGKPDQTVQWDDGSYGVIDFKTSAIRDASHYAKQLETYARAYAEPGGRSPHLAPVTKMGLLVFEPQAFTGAGLTLSLQGQARWIEVPRQGAGFSYFLEGILTTLESSELPPSNPNCPFCQYRRRFEPRPEATTHPDQLALLHFGDEPA